MIICKVSVMIYFSLLLTSPVDEGEDGMTITAEGSSTHFPKSSLLTNTAGGWQCGLIPQLPSTLLPLCHLGSLMITTDISISIKRSSSGLLTSSSCFYLLLTEDMKLKNLICKKEAVTVYISVFFIFILVEYNFNP